VASQDENEVVIMLMMMMGRHSERKESQWMRREGCQQRRKMKENCGRIMLWKVKHFGSLCIPPSGREKHTSAGRGNKQIPFRYYKIVINNRNIEQTNTYNYLESLMSYEKDVPCRLDGPKGLSP
jgi:hypothetical protein